MEVLTLDISKENELNPIVYGRVGDGDIQTVKVFVTNNETPYDLTGAVITFEGTLFNNRAKIFDSDGVKITDAKNGTFTYTFPNPSFGVSGRYETAYFSFFYSKTKRTTTSDFIIEVLPNADIDAEEAKTIITEYNRLVEDLRELQKKNITELQNEIDDTKNKIAELRSQLDNVNGKVQATDAKADDIVKKIDAHDVYVKKEVDDRFLATNKGDVTTQDWNTILSDGIYPVNDPSGDNKAPNADFGYLEVVNGYGLTQIYHYVNGDSTTRTYAGNPPVWSEWGKNIKQLDVKNYVDSRMATQDETNAGDSADKIVSPKTLLGSLEQFRSSFLKGKREFQINNSNSNYIDSGQIIFQRCWDQVFVTGIFKTKSEIPAGTSYLTAGELPDWVKADTNRNFFSMYDSTVINIYLDSHSNNVQTDGIVVPAGKWVAVTASSYPVRE